jgi:murein DD-endopeptidase MepM/ murein hydrolase activator NlpD
MKSRKSLLWMIVQLTPILSLGAGSANSLFFENSAAKESPCQGRSSRERMFQWPTIGPATARYPPSGGLDFYAPSGSPVRAAAAGFVAYVGDFPGFSGVILIRHHGGFVSAYGNIADIEVLRGDTVSRGRRIAVALPRDPSNPRLPHFELRRNGTSVDPRQYLECRQSAHESSIEPLTAFQ